MMAKLREMMVVVVGCLLPAMVTARTTVFGSCDDGVGFSDGLMQTQEGIDIMNTWSGLKLVAWNDDQLDKGMTCLTLTVSGHTMTLSFKLDGSPKTTVGTVEVVHNNGKNNYLDVDTRRGTRVISGMFQENSGKIQMYVHYLSETEVTIKTCRNRFLSCTESFYVFSSHDYSHLTTKCIENTSGSFAGFSMKMAPACA